MKWTLLWLTSLWLIFPYTAFSQDQSVARQWNELLLESIRTDFARPPVHARNLFHVSVAMYDAWAAYDSMARPYLLGNKVGNFTCAFDGIPKPDDVEAARKEAISYAAYRLLTWRFLNSPGFEAGQNRFDSLMNLLGYNKFNNSKDYKSGSPAALGNYIADCLIRFGLQDGSNEANIYANQYYMPFNPPMITKEPGNPRMLDPNRWQALTLDVFIDQSGNVIPFNTPAFQSPEWGNVLPFSMGENDRVLYQRDGHDYWVYHDPGPPPHLDSTLQGFDDPYKWNFALVAIWGAHLNAGDGNMVDISPANQGNTSLDQLPHNQDDLRDFYRLFSGGDVSKGHNINPVTGQPYAPNIVPRGDYTRVLAEFWADGPHSETPPGHWFVLLNEVHDHPLFERRYRGKGPLVDNLEWDVKAYFALGGTMHDAAISAWGIKGYYDYVRPISAIRYMADQGQSSDPNQPRYNPKGLPLLNGYIELVKSGDPLAGVNNENVNKIKLFTWRGHPYIRNTQTDVAGVGWILAENWWPYQRPSFVTPPFAGYVSGHSTYSRAAADLLTYFTGSAYFPGGVGEFTLKKNEYLVFEDGPSQDITLQWATYSDASDQCSLSRIWGGIHPPTDDIPGRRIGAAVGKEAFEFAESYFFRDQDGDGYNEWVDCDDRNPAINPGRPEICDGRDNNCSGMPDDSLTVSTYYLDSDSDGFGDPEFRLDTCLSEAPQGYVNEPNDCDDSDATITNGNNGNCDTPNSVAQELLPQARVFPNPAKDQLNIRMDYDQAVDIRLISLDGKVLLQQEKLVTGNGLTLDIQGIQTGLYLLELRSRQAERLVFRKIAVY